MTGNNAITIVPAQFDKYEEASEAVYKILLHHTAAVQLISCDEAYLDISGLGDPAAIAAAIRAEVNRTYAFMFSPWSLSGMVNLRCLTPSPHPFLWQARITG